MSIQELKRENEELRKQLQNKKCPAKENPLDAINKLGLNLPKNVEDLKPARTAEISECQVPAKYFGKTNLKNVRCKDALQTQISHDRDVSKLLFILLSIILPVVFVFLSITNSTKLNFVHYILLFTIIALSMITIASTQGKALSGAWIIRPENSDCNTCQYNAKLPVISIFIGMGITLIAYITDMILTTYKLR